MKSDNNLGLKNQVRDLEAQIAQERTHGLGLWNEIERVRAAIDDCQRNNNETSERIWIYEHDLS